MVGRRGRSAVTADAVGVAAVFGEHLRDEPRLNRIRVEMPGDPELNSAMVAHAVGGGPSALFATTHASVGTVPSCGSSRTRHPDPPTGTCRRLDRPTEQVHRRRAEVIPGEHDHVRRAVRRSRRQMRVSVRFGVPQVQSGPSVPVVGHDDFPSVGCSAPARDTANRRTNWESTPRFASDESEAPR